MFKDLKLIKRMNYKYNVYRLIDSDFEYNIAADYPNIVESFFKIFIDIYKNNSLIKNIYLLSTFAEVEHSYGGLIFLLELNELLNKKFPHFVSEMEKYRCLEN